MTRIKAKGQGEEVRAVRSKGRETAAPIKAPEGVARMVRAMIPVVAATTMARDTAPAATATITMGRDTVPAATATTTMVRDVVPAVATRAVRGTAAAATTDRAPRTASLLRVARPSFSTARASSPFTGEG